MTQRSVFLSLSLVFATVMVCFAARLVEPTIAATKTLALVGGKIYISPQEPPIADGVVLVSGAKIVAVGSAARVKIPNGATIIDCAGRTVMAGFQNSHVHFDGPKWVDAAHLPAGQLSKQFQEMLTRYGFTTVVDTASVVQNTTALRRRIETGEISGPRILTAGFALYPTNGIPFYLTEALPPELLKLVEAPATPDEAIADVQRNLDNGADILKLFTASWVNHDKIKPMDTNIARAAANEAHRRGKLVFAHPSDIHGLDVALAAHVDVLAHAIEDMREWNDSYIPRMKAAHMSMIPTLKLFSLDTDLPAILREVGSYSSAGGQILFGTDVGFLNDFDPTKEYELMARAGLSVNQILASVTTAPAERFKESDSRGRIAPGMAADIVILAGDPATDVASFAKVQYTIRNGAIIFAANR